MYRHIGVVKPRNHRGADLLASSSIGQPAMKVKASGKLDPSILLSAASTSDQTKNCKEYRVAVLLKST